MHVHLEKWAMSRRHVLRGSLGMAIGLPLLDAMACNQARSGSTRVGQGRLGLGSRPKRLIVFHTDNGVVTDAWRPTGSEREFEFGEILSPLAPHKQDVIVMDGLDMSCNHDGSHQGANGGVLTGSFVLSPEEANGVPYLPSSISIDQAYADHVAGETKERAIVLGQYDVPISSTGPAQAVHNEFDLWGVKDRLFADANIDPAVLANLRANRHSVLDDVMDDYKALAPRLGAADRKKLEAHLDSIRDIESRIDLGGGCVPADIGTGNPYLTPPDDFLRIASTLTRRAFACDLTRIVTIHVAAQEYLPGVTSDYHPLAHAASVGDPDAIAQVIIVNRWMAERFAGFIQDLKDEVDAEGTSLLDDTVLLWTNEHHDGNHTTFDIPLVLAGRAGGYFDTGRFVQYEDRSHNDLLLTVIDALGMPQATFGDPSLCKGTLANLKA